MKSKPEFDTPLEETLAEFEMAPLPSEWKSELIENAVLQAAERKRSRVSPIMKIAIGALAACWVAIVWFQITTPSPTGISDTGMTNPSKLTPEELPMVAAYFLKLGESKQNF